MTALVKILDASGNPITSANPLAVVIPGGITLTGEVEIKNDAGNPVPVAVSAFPAVQEISATALPLPAGAASETTAAGIRTDLGTDGATPPSIPGTGVRGWLRSIYDTLRATLTVQGVVTANAGSGTFNTRVLTSGTDSVTILPSGTQAVSGTVTANINNFPGTQNVAVTNTPSVTVSGTASVTVANSPTVSVNNYPGIQAVSGTVAVSGTTDVAIASGPGIAAGTPAFTQDVIGGAPVSLTNPVPVVPVPSTLALSAVGAAAAAVTVTLPAAGAGLFHYIDAIEITLMNSAARTGSATPVTATSTNLPGPLAWTFGSAGAIGTIDRYFMSADRPLRSATANTATTIVCPAATGVIWRVNVIYSTGP